MGCSSKPRGRFQLVYCAGTSPGGTSPVPFYIIMIGSGPGTCQDTGSGKTLSEKGFSWPGGYSPPGISPEIDFARTALCYYVAETVRLEVT